MDREQTGIFVDGYNLLKALHTANIQLTVSERKEYGERAICQVEQFLEDFTMAYDFPEERGYYLRKMVARFSTAKITLRIMTESNIFKGAKNHKGEVAIKNQIFEYVAKIDTGICRWRKSFEKGKTGVSLASVKTDNY